MAMKKLVVIAALAFTLFSCSEKDIYDIQIKNNYWHKYTDTEIIYDDGTIINIGDIGIGASSDIIPVESQKIKIRFRTSVLGNVTVGYLPQYETSEYTLTEERLNYIVISKDNWYAIKKMF